MTDDVATVIERVRPQLHGVAYRLLGSVAEAEDAVQEACLQLEQHGLDGIDESEAWLVRVTSRRALDRLRSAQHRRERYVGPWLPEPLLVSDDVADDVEVAESLSMAFLLVLESLSPAERVAFVLHDVFGHGYDDLLEVLAPDVVLRSDVGGVVSAARRAVTGADRVARFLLGVFAQAPDDLTVEVARVNGSLGVVARRADGSADTVFAVEVADGRVVAVNGVRNPAKLGHLDA